MEFHEFTAMNTSIVLAAEGQPGRVAEGFRQAERLVREYEQRFTRFTETSELAELNRASGNWFIASRETYTVVDLAYGYYQDTAGLFNPGILKALAQAGYDRSMAEIRTLGDRPAAPTGEAYTVPPFDQVRLDPERCAILLPHGLTIDLGGIAKGWIAEQAAHRLAIYARACAVNAGGDLFATGVPSDSPAWPVAVDDPLHPGEDLTVLYTPPGAVATSSVVKRTWKQGGEKRHHLIDPRSGRPAETPWASVTVLVSQAARAEVLAKAMLIAGPLGSAELVRRNPDAAFLVVDQDGKLFGSESIRKYQHELV